MWFTGINYYKLAIEKDRDSIFTTIWKLGFRIVMKNWRFFEDKNAKKLLAACFNVFTEPRRFLARMTSDLHKSRFKLRGISF
jgi:hypothetical protein